MKNNIEPIMIGKLEIRYLQDGSESGLMGVFELTIPSHSNVPPPHYHVHNEEVVYVLEGKLRYSVGKEKRDLNPGETMATPKGIVHGFSNPFDVTARALIVNIPDIGAQYFRDVAAIFNAGGPPDKAKLKQVAEHYGVKVTLLGKLAFLMSTSSYGSRLLRLLKIFKRS